MLRCVAASVRHATRRAVVAPAAAATPGLGRAAHPRVTAARALAAVKPGGGGVDDVIPEVKPGVPGQTPSIFDQATGLERAEIEHPDLFKHNEVLRGPFGTLENPVLIQSNFESRIVGCTGKAPPDDHDLFWINVEKNEHATCPQCSQVFKLDPL